MRNLDLEDVIGIVLFFVTTFVVGVVIGVFAAKNCYEFYHYFTNSWLIAIMITIGGYGVLLQIIMSWIGIIFTNAGDRSDFEEKLDYEYLEIGFKRLMKFANKVSD